MSTQRRELCMERRRVTMRPFDYRKYIRGCVSFKGQSVFILHFRSDGS